jgi:ABC-2 type transport system permease protein
MSVAFAVRLLIVEIRLFLMQPFTWFVFAVLGVLMMVGAHNGAAFVARQEAAAVQAAAHEQRMRDVGRDAHRKYAGPTGLEIPQWRDATNAYGYLTQFLVAYAAKPSTPLAPLAVGVSDIQPTQVRLAFTFSSVFDDAAYDIGSARAERLGAFDLSFVLIYLVPLGLIALAGARLSGEHDSGILRMLAAQPATLRVVALAKFGAVGLVAMVVLLAQAGVALRFAAGVEPGEWCAVLGWLAAALALYIVFWVALCAWVASLWRGAVAALALLVMAWTCTAVLAPAAAMLLLDSLHPPPSRIAYIESSREAQAHFYDHGEIETVPPAWLARNYPQLAPRSEELVKTSEIRRLARDDFFRDTLAPQRIAFERYAVFAARRQELLAMLSPALMLDMALRSAAGSDTYSHAKFMRAVGEHRYAIWKFFEPRVVAQVAQPKPVCDGCRARLDFDAYDAVPGFSAPLDASRPLHRARWTCLYLAVLVALLSVVTGRRLREWP